jgi:hypothetical protein
VPLCIRWDGVVTGMRTCCGALTLDSRVKRAGQAPPLQALVMHCDWNTDIHGDEWSAIRTIT